MIDQSGGSMETGAVLEYMDELGIPVTTITHPTYQIMKEREERSPCSLCANMRRGMLANAAPRGWLRRVSARPSQGRRGRDGADEPLLRRALQMLPSAPLYEPDADKGDTPDDLHRRASDKA